MSNPRPIPSGPNAHATINTGFCQKRFHLSKLIQKISEEPADLYPEVAFSSVNDTTMQVTSFKNHLFNSVQQYDHHNWCVRVRVQSSYFSWKTGRRNQLMTSWCPLQFFFSQLTCWCWQTWRCWPTNSPGDHPHFQLISVQSFQYPSGRIAKQHDWTTSSKGMTKLLLRRKASMRKP